MEIYQQKQNILFVSKKYKNDWQLKFVEQIEINKTFDCKEKLLNYIRSGDILYVISLVMLDGTTSENIKFLDELENRKVIFKSVIEPDIDNTAVDKFKKNIMLGVGTFITQFIENINH